MILVSLYHPRDQDLARALWTHLTVLRHVVDHFDPWLLATEHELEVLEPRVLGCDLFVPFVSADLLPFFETPLGQRALSLGRLGPFIAPVQLRPCILPLWLARPQVRGAFSQGDPDQNGVEIARELRQVIQQLLAGGR